MRKRFKVLILTVLSLLISSSVVQAKVISYEVKTSNGNIKSYDNDKLIESFLRFKVNEDGSEYYNNFIKNLTTGKYILFRHHSKKYVKYDDIMNTFLEAKVYGRKFDLEEYMLNAKGIELNNTMFEEKPESVEVKQVADKVQESLADINMPVMSREEVKELNNDMTSGRWRTDLGFDKIDEGNRIMESLEDTADGSYYKSLGLPSDTNPYSMNELRLSRKRLDSIRDKYFKNDKFKYLTDLDNFKNMKGVTVDFSKVQNDNMYLQQEQIAYYGKDISSIKLDDSFVIQDDYSQGKSATIFLDYKNGYYPITIWRPDMERGFIETINKMRVAKGMKPLEYDVNLHAMSRYCAKRNHYTMSRCGSLANSCFSPTSVFRFWANGSIAYAFNKPYSTTTDKALTSVAGNEKKLFNYDGHVKALCAVNPLFSKPEDFIDYWNYYSKSESGEWWHGDTETFKPFDLRPNLSDTIFNPKMTKIGVGYIHETPMCQMEINGVNGVFIMVE